MHKISYIKPPNVVLRESSTALTRKKAGMLGEASNENTTNIQIMTDTIYIVEPLEQLIVSQVATLEPCSDSRRRCNTYEVTFRPSSSMI